MYYCFDLLSKVTLKVTNNNKMDQTSRWFLADFLQKVSEAFEYVKVFVKLSTESFEDPTLSW